jgi:hypothetical protein
MTYTTIDGTSLNSDPNQPVTYTCNSNGFPDGVYTSLETTSAVNQYGIQQIKVSFTVENGTANYNIVESTGPELEAYIESFKTPNNVN